MDPDPIEVEYPVLSHANARLSEDGQALLVEAPTFSDETVRFALTLPDVRNLIGFLLTALAGISRDNPQLAAVMRQHGEPAAPIAISSFCVSDTALGSEAMVVIGVGPTELAFSLPLTAFDPIGRAMLTASARPAAAGPT
jgi:hypothetical protein